MHPSHKALAGYRTYDGFHDEDMQHPVAVEVEFEDCGDSCAGGDEELVLPASVRDGDAVPQELDGVHDDIFRIPGEPQVKVTS